MLNILDYLIIFAFIIGMALLVVGAVVVKKVLKMHEKSYKDEELLTEEESVVVGKYFNYIAVGFIFISIYYGLQVLRNILK
jgi:hypothetical protein